MQYYCEQCAYCLDKNTSEQQTTSKEIKVECSYRNNILLLKVHDMVPANDSHLFTL
jgi:hypothetical protein